MSIQELKDYISRLKETKEILKPFKTKKEAVDYLMKETSLSKQECSNAYDIIMKMDFDKY